jgi:hypothetical protein
LRSYSSAVKKSKKNTEEGFIRPFDIPDE